MQTSPAWLLSVFLLAATSCGREALAAGMEVTPAEMAEARRFAAAKFQQLPEPTAPREGLNVLQAYGPVIRNRQAELPLVLAGKTYDRGFYCHAHSEILVRLPGKGRRLESLLGVNSNHMTQPGRGSIVCAVRVGGAEAFRSQVLREGMEAVPVDVDLKDAEEFILEVTDSGDDISCDQSAWGDARVTLADGRTLWLGDMPLHQGRLPYTTEPPFSFVYDGKPSAEWLAAWGVRSVSREIDAVRTEHVLISEDPQTKLSVRCVAVEYRDFPTLEWTVYLKNGGAAPTPILSDIQSIDVSLSGGAEGAITLHHARGDDCSSASYQPLSTPLEPGAAQAFAPVGGRPTTGAFPYFNLAWQDEGVILAVGWPGQWAARFQRDPGAAVHVVAGQERTRLRLLPGEEIRTPLAVAQWWSGDRTRAQNLWRRWMIAHNMPRPGGAPPAPMFTSCSGGFFPGLKCNETDELRFLDAFAAHGVKLDYWWMDAGWYPCDAWPQTGTWTPDPERFPRGIRAVSDRVHAQAAKLILWFEPERVAPGTWLAENHPDWILGGAGGGLLNLGHAEARAWLTDHVDRLLTEQGIDLYRQDFNIDPLQFWRDHDPPEREGITENHHVQGYLAWWDELRRRHPDMLIDSCASGGRRNDLETLRRAVPLLRSDYQSFAGDPGHAPGNQCHTLGLAPWIPYFGQGTYYNPRQPLYNARSHYCPAFGYCGDVRTPGIDWDTIARVAGDWRAISDCFLGDFYPLTPYSLDSGVWMAWQFHRPERGEGMIQVFRRGESIYESARLRLQGLEPETRYRIVDLDSSTPTEVLGRDLADPGLLVTLPARPSAALFTYRPAAPGGTP